MKPSTRLVQAGRRAEWTGPVVNPPVWRASTHVYRDSADLARGRARFSGEQADFRPNIASGHIPGSCNLPYNLLFQHDGTFCRRSNLKRAFELAGIDLHEPVVTTCGGGVTAAVLLFALHLLGKGDVALYDGSWSEWGADPATPKELGTGA
jgi:thiosulfate/3-mercaptopyruvate sulfurtransferase